MHGLSASSFFFFRRAFSVSGFICAFQMGLVSEGLFLSQLWLFIVFPKLKILLNKLCN